MVVSVPPCSAQAGPAKEAGNKAFAAQRYDAAVEHFSEAIRADPGSALLRSNRAGALSSLGRHCEALEDAAMCISIQPDWWKGYIRRGHAQFQLGRFADSERSYLEAQKLNPDEKAVALGLEQSRQRMREMGIPLHQDNESVALRSAAGGAAPVAAPVAAPGAAAERAAASDAFQRRTPAEMRASLKRNVGQLSDRALDAELQDAGVNVPPGTSRAQKVKIYLDLASACVAGGGPAAQPPGQQAAPSAKRSNCDITTKGDELLEKRRQWVEQWSTWDNARLVQELRRLGVDGTGLSKADLIDVLLQEKTDRYARSGCTSGRMQAAGLATAALAILGTFGGMAIALTSNSG
eukprot:CAMPEP_0203841042 /NCGR_PEP_ID=MMETSP0359-20131031/1136_1 /ASSEMBLY_ACC=CAM_ASM_000338 /TAXON_ID=268821 /ORGANISM="Scrippsiella Hangoei, Strain SHTV-5" /LENGTH=349 /DNA_ID=CAMNT_0050755355 /DNA_START=23 /DNA_END=1072 /DNA_ORIENTATION=+